LDVVSVGSQNFLQQDQIEPTVKFKPNLWHVRNKLKAYFLWNGAAAGLVLLTLAQTLQFGQTHP
jgi:hypothetical protein